MTTTTVISVPYTGSNQIAIVDSTYGVPVTAHMWGAGGGSTSLYPGGGGGYSQVQFVANPGDTIEVVIGQGGGAGGRTQPPLAPPTTWTTRSEGCSTTLYTGAQFNQSFYVVPVATINTYGVWNVPYPPGTGINGQIQVWDWASVYFPVSGTYTIQGSSYANTNSVSIDGAVVISDSQGNLYPVQATVYVAAGYHSISITTTYYDRRQRTAASVAYTINQSNPSRIPNTPAGRPGAAYIALLFNTRFPPPTAGATPVYAYGNGDSFLDQWGVWGADQTELSFARTYNVTFLAPYKILFEMSASNIGTLAFDGSTVITRTAANNPNTPTQYFADVAAGTYTLVISATGAAGALNRVGVILSYGGQKSFSGGRGGISDPTSRQGFGGGGGGATVLAVNEKFIGIAGGGAGGAGAAPTNIDYITTKYTGSTATQPFGAPGLSGWPGSWAPVVIAPGTSGWYELSYTYTVVDSGATFSGPVVSYCVVVNGVRVYGPTAPVGSGAALPPANTFQRGKFVGYSYSVYQPGGGTDYTFFTAVYNLDYTSLASNAITDAQFNGQNGQDVFNFNTTDTGGGGGGGGGSRGGNGGAGRGSGGGGFSGYNGLSLGDSIVDSTGRLPHINAYYPYGGVAEGGATGETATRYIGNPATDPFHSVDLVGSGYYVRNTGVSGGSNLVIGYYVIVNGTSVYQSLGGAAQAPPVSLAVKAGFVGYSYNQTFDVDGVPHYENVECFSFDYITSTAGGNGGNGFVALEFQTGGGGSIKDGGEWKSVQTIYVNDQGVWKEAQSVFINQEGIWKPVQGAPVPVFLEYNSLFGAWTRPYSAGSLLAPPPPAPSYTEIGGSTSDGYGGGGDGGGGKVICTALYELGLMDKDIYQYDQAFGQWLYQNNPVAYKGYRMWADILVAYVKGEGRPLLPKLMFWKSRDEQQALSQRIAISVAQFVGSAFANEIARRAGHNLPWSLRGWLTVSLGLIVCKSIGFVFAKTKKYKELTQ